MRHALLNTCTLIQNGIYYMNQSENQCKVWCSGALAGLIFADTHTYVLYNQAYSQVQFSQWAIIRKNLDNIRAIVDMIHSI